MSNYGFVNNIGELKQIQTNVYKGEGYYVGITRNGFAYIFDGKETKRLSKEEVGSYLGLSVEQTDKLLKSRGKIQFDSSKEGDNVGAQTIQISEVTPVVKPGAKVIDKKLDEKSKVSTKSKDTQVGREKLAEHAGDSSRSEVVVEEKAPVGKTEAPENVPSLEESNGSKLSLKKQVRFLTEKIKFLEENMVTKEQMLKIIESLSKGE